MVNLLVMCGDMVRYHPVIGEIHDGKKYTVRATGRLESGQRVVWLREKSGCVSIDAISKYIPGSEVVTK